MLYLFDFVSQVSALVFLKHGTKPICKVRSCHWLACCSHMDIVKTPLQRHQSTAPCHDPRAVSSLLRRRADADVPQDRQLAAVPALPGGGGGAPGGPRPHLPPAVRRRAQAGQPRRRRRNQGAPLSTLKGVHPRSHLLCRKPRQMCKVAAALIACNRTECFPRTGQWMLGAFVQGACSHGGCSAEPAATVHPTAVARTPRRIDVLPMQARPFFRGVDRERLMQPAATVHCTAAA